MLFRSQARSVLYGLLAGACDVLEISRDDIDGTVIPSQGNALVLFDTVPAGAGLVRRIAEEMQRVVVAMATRVSECDCGLETSCYRCLRVYRNQAFHEELRRALILDALSSGGPSGAARAARAAVDETIGSAGLADADGGWLTLLPGTTASEAAAITALVGFGLPVPEMGLELGDGIPVSFSWPDQRVVLDVELQPDDRAYLSGDGWKVVPVDGGLLQTALTTDGLRV